MPLRSHRQNAAPLPLRLGALVATLVAGATWVHGDAKAEWPPPESAQCADLKDSKYWPNDPGYGFQASADPSKRSSGDWNFFCFLPDRNPGAPPVRQGETASGMSVDLAFRHTVGDPRVKIAVLDSGIEWDSSDVIEAAWLSPTELAKTPPHKADGSACATITIPTFPGKTVDFAGDCNGDGILTVADYADEPSLKPAAATGHPAGDKNNNGHLDAGDLILNFSDGLDDDGNGFIDDISGWDFMKDDNDPYDDTRYGHGTGEANDSTARANNGQGDLGMCPGCRFMPLRVGDSFITDVNNFGKAVTYAVDNNAKVIQEALGTINNSSFAMAALDYAYFHNVTVIASMADENARHHNLPAANNHTLPVHAISPGPTEDATQATTFLAFNLCTNYGAQNFLSSSSTSCSSGATGTLSGMTGLVYSAGMKYLDANGKPPLTAAEVQQLFMMTADDINVPESQQPNPKYFWSQPGFDQRFGYGRVNANTAVEQVRDGKIPPEVDVVSPTWFEILYKAKGTGPVSIKGHVSALRATSYDYVIEAAGGVQPLDAQFKQIFASPANIPGATVTTGDLGSFDFRNFDITHDADSDSLYGENNYTVTVRVKVTAHYGGSIGDVKGEMRRAYYIYDDPDLLPGFPMRLGGGGESSPKLADIDGDGSREIVLATDDGLIHAISNKGGAPAELPGFPYKAGRIDGLRVGAAGNHLSAPGYQAGAGNVDPELARNAFVASVGVADLDGDGKPEIVDTSYDGYIYVVGSDGKDKPGWPKAMPDVPSCPLDPTVTPDGPCTDEQHIIQRGAFASPVLVDMDKDGKLEIVVASFDGNVYAYHADGTDLAGWPVAIHYTGVAVPAKEWNRVMTTPAIVDFNGDGIPDVLVGSNEKLGEGGGAGAFYIVDGRGNAAGSPPYLKNWPQTMASLHLFPVVAEGVPNSPIAADINGDGKPEAIMHGNVSTPLIVPADPGDNTKFGAMPPNALPCHPDPNNPEDTTKQQCGVYASSIFGDLSKAARPDTMFPLFAMPSAGDIDQDGTPDVIASGGSLNLAINLQAKGGVQAKAGDQLLAVWSGKTGAMMPGSPFLLEDFTFFNSQAVADLNGDDYPEVITGSGGYYVHAYDGCGREPEGWPKFTGQWVISTVAVGDIDGDHTLEAVTASRAGWLYAWHTKGKDDGIIEWESFHHDNQNTGYLGTKLDQGNPTRKAATALFCPTGEDTTAAPTSPDAGGGCSCEVRKTGNQGAWALASLGLGLAIARRRRRRA